MLASVGLAWGHGDAAQATSPNGRLTLKAQQSGYALYSGNLLVMEIPTVGLGEPSGQGHRGPLQLVRRISDMLRPCSAAVASWPGSTTTDWLSATR